jgi:hypothetical protein
VGLETVILSHPLQNATMYLRVCPHDIGNMHSVCTLPLIAFFPLVSLCETDGGKLSRKVRRIDSRLWPLQVHIRVHISPARG